MNIRLYYFLTILSILIFGCDNKKYKTIIRYSYFEFTSQSFQISRDTLSFYAKSDSNALIVGAEQYIKIGKEYINKIDSLSIYTKKPISFKVTNEEGKQMSTSTLKRKNILHSVESINNSINKIYIGLFKRDSIENAIDLQEIIEYEKVGKIDKNGYIDLSYSIKEIEDSFKMSKKKYQSWSSGNDIIFRQGNKRFSFELKNGRLNSISVFFEDVDCPYGKYEELNNNGFISIDCTRSPLRIESNKNKIRIIY